MNARKLSVSLSLTLAGLALAAILLLMRSTVQAQPSAAVICVAATGTDNPGCGSVGSPCQTIQYAISQAGDDDEIRVAGGTYTGVQTHATPTEYRNPPTSGVITQVVYVDKAVTIQGGYTTTDSFAGPPDPAANPTIVDAKQQGRAMFVSADATVTGLRLTGGDAIGLGGHPNVGSPGAGGGIYLYQADGIVLERNTIVDNLAQSGGGVFAYQSNAKLTGNAILTNTATGYHYDFYGGGGVYLYESDAIMSDNNIVGNWGESGHGGGMYLRFSDATLFNNIISGNRSYWNGGGLYLHVSDGSRLFHNTISGNRTTTVYGDGGGLSLVASDAILADNVISGNAAGGSYNSYDGGGGLHLNDSWATLSRNTIISNTSARSGGGLVLRESNAKLDNNIIADNQAGPGVGYGPGTGAGVHVYRSNPGFDHTTLARNYGGDGSGVYVTGAAGRPSSMAMTNTIIVSHTVGITIAAGSTATLESTLWGTGSWANVTPWDGDGTVIPANDYQGNPDFVDYAARDYHIGPGSAALDKGVDTEDILDIDCEPHFYEDPDLGADEYWPPGTLKRVYLPLTLRE